MKTSVALRVSKILGFVFLAAMLGLLAFGCYLYFVWASAPKIDRVLAEPYESFLLYSEHYDWVRAPFLQAFRVASVCAILIGAARLLPRVIGSWRVWIPGLVFLFSIQITIFNSVVNDMTAGNWLYSVYLAMSWFEPWLVVTLASVGPGFYSTGGVAFVALMLSALALFTIRRKRGSWIALAETCFFVSGALLVFELGILEYKSMWWNLWVSQFQFTLGIQWLTNSMLYSVTISCVILFACLRFALWRTGDREVHGLSREK